MGDKAHEEKFFPFRLMPHFPSQSLPQDFAGCLSPKAERGGGGGGRSQQCLGAVEAYVELSNTFLEGKHLANLLLATVKLARGVFFTITARILARLLANFHCQ